MMTETQSSPRPRPNIEYYNQAYHTFSTKKKRKLKNQVLQQSKPYRGYNNVNFIISSIDYTGSYFYKNYILLEQLGCGSFGIVFKVKERKNPQIVYACKITPILGGNNEFSENDIPFHNNIVNRIDSWQEEKLHFTIMELCEINLNEFISNNSDFFTTHCSNFFVDILLGIKHLHDLDYIHLDIKPDNILVKNNTFKLGDFGMAKNLRRDVDFLEGDCKYMAPELLQGNFTKKADIFSFGMSILEICTDLDLPSFGECWQKIRKGILPLEILLEAKIPEELENTIRWMICQDFNSRPSIDELLETPWIQNISKSRRQIEINHNVLSSSEEIMETDDADPNENEKITPENNIIFNLVDPHDSSLNHSQSLAPCSDFKRLPSFYFSDTFNPKSNRKICSSLRRKLCPEMTFNPKNIEELAMNLDEMFDDLCNDASANNTSQDSEDMDSF